MNRYIWRSGEVTHADAPHCIHRGHSEYTLCLPSTAVAAPKFMFNAVRNTTTAIGTGIKGTANALSPFAFFHKLTRGAVVGIGVALGLIVFVILLCCLVTLWRCVRRNDKRESQGLLYQMPFRKAAPVPYYTMYHVPEPQK
ncbi:uncharacterized protein LOC142774676 isoform X2 [Rhipicephalus microplus]|uniref:uncharacterized protein LOC142774676 isoform X2 n=1 Tax=Rhipicephalus microplus TaxID=6941 RepID=UPI003F6CED0F